MNTVDRIMTLTHLHRRGRTNLLRSEFREAYHDLSLLQARELAHRAVGLEDREPAEEILLCLARSVPGALDEIHDELLAREWLYPPELYCGAEASARDRLFELL